MRIAKPSAGDGGIRIDSIGAMPTFFGMPLNPAFFGLSLVCCWDYGIQRLALADADIALQTLHFFGMALVCLVLFLLALQKNKSSSTNRILMVGMPLLAIFCVLLLVFGSNYGLSKSWQLALRLLAGACSGWLYLIWGPFYQGLGIRQSVFVLFSSVIAASLLKAILAAIAAPMVSAIIYALIPLLVVVCWHVSEKYRPLSTGRTDKYTDKSLWFFKNPLIGAAAFSFVIGILLGMDAGLFTLNVAEQLFTHLLVVIVCLAIIVLCIRNSELLELPNAWILVLLTITTALVIVGFFGAPAVTGTLAILAAAQRFVAVFIWLALSDVAHNSSFKSDTVFGLGKGIYSLSVALGLLVSSLLQLGFGDLKASLLVVYITMIALLFFLRDKMPQTLRLLGDLSPSVTNEQASKLEYRITELAISHGLSDREQEIILLYAQGRSRSFISTQLFISENTVRDHIRNVYRKLDIHDKQTLIDVIQSNQD